MPKLHAIINGKSVSVDVSEETEKIITEAAHKGRSTVSKVLWTIWHLYGHLSPHTVERFIKERLKQ